MDSLPRVAYLRLIRTDGDGGLILFAVAGSIPRGAGCFGAG